MRCVPNVERSAVHAEEASHSSSEVLHCLLEVIHQLHELGVITATTGNYDLAGLTVASSATTQLAINVLLPPLWQRLCVSL